MCVHLVRASVLVHLYREHLGKTAAARHVTILAVHPLAFIIFLVELFLTDAAFVISLLSIIVVLLVLVQVDAECTDYPAFVLFLDPPLQFSLQPESDEHLQFILVHPDALDTVPFDSKVHPCHWLTVESGESCKQVFLCAQVDRGAPAYIDYLTVNRPTA